VIAQHRINGENLDVANASALQDRFSRLRAGHAGARSEL
jgi:hypothetical protein